MFCFNCIPIKHQTEEEQEQEQEQESREKEKNTPMYGHSTSIDTMTLRRDQYSVYQLPQWNKLQMNEPIPRTDWQKAHTNFAT